MRLPKEIINVVGILVTVAIIAVGVALVALPLFTAAQSQAVAVAQAETTNSSYQERIDQLRAAEKELPATTANVAELRKRIRATNDFDDVFQVVTSAASASGATVTSVVPGTPAAYATRTATVVAVAGTANGASPAAPEPSPSPSPSSGAATTTVGSAVTGSGITAAEQRQQVPVTISVSVPDAASAAAFLDALSNGPRIITISHTVLVSGGSGGATGGANPAMTLTVNAFTYTSSEG